MSLVAIVLAAGKGTRMKSDRPKVLHELHGKPLIDHVLESARSAAAHGAIVVVGYKAQEVSDHVEARHGAFARFAVQAEQNGTGHAVLCALSALREHEDVALILSGDVPRIAPETLTALRDACVASDVQAALLSFVAHDPTGYGRIVRNAGGVGARRIVEHKDASEEQRRIRECNAGVYCIATRHLEALLPTLGSQNAAGEIYLTDLIEKLSVDGTVACLEVPEAEVAGVNTLQQLAAMHDGVA